MYDSLSTGVSRRLFAAGDLSMTEVHEHEGGAEALMAQPALKTTKWSFNSPDAQRVIAEAPRIAGNYAYVLADNECFPFGDSREGTTGDLQDDVLSGGSGEDLVIGGRGLDMLIGGFASVVSANAGADEATLAAALAELWQDGMNIEL